MAIPKDDGAAVPALPADAGPHERTLHKVFGFSSPLVRDTAEDWRQTADGVDDLSRDVAWVVKALQGADEPWSGPAAENAYASLTALSASLDEHAEMMRNIKKSLDVAAQAADVARSDYHAKVATVSTDVDRSGYTRTVTPDGPVKSPAQERTVFDQQGYDQAVADRRQEREQAAKTALDTFTSSMGGAAKTMPVDAPFDPVTIDPGTGGGSGAPSGGGPTGGSPGTTSYQPPSGSNPTWPPSGTWVPTTQNPGFDPVDDPTSTGTTTTPSSWSPSPAVQAPSWSGGGVELDGSTTGTTTPTTGGSTTWAGTSASGSTGSTSGGVGAGVAGAGGLLGGGAMLLGRGALGRGAAFGLPGGAAGRPGSVVAGSTGAGARGTSAAAGRGAGGAGRPVVAPGNQGTGRGGRGAGGSGVRGARSGGRYGVPKLGRSGGAGASGRGVVAGTGAGGRGRKERDDAVDVEALTHEDEETWFEGEDEAGPPVWR